MMKSALVARARAPARSRHLSKIPLAHVVPHRVGVELLERSRELVGRGTVERPWFLSRFPTTGFLPRNGTHFTAGESGVY